MIILKNVYHQSFLNDVQEKRIILFGNGDYCNKFLSNAANYKLHNKIDVILDNNPKVDHRIINNRKVMLSTLNDFISFGWDLSKYIIVIMVSNTHFMEIVEILDKFSIFNDIYCYYGPTILSWDNKRYPEPTLIECPKPIKKHNIPKKIHCCWFGRSELPAIAQKCIESWRKHCPDYQIIIWNEDNYDISDAPTYVKQAYEAKKYAFVTDFVRLDVVYKHGGFYLDLDVELLRSLDNFLEYKSVFGFESNNAIATGLGFGSIINNPLIDEHRNIYKEISFLHEDGSYNLTPCPAYSNEFFKEYGVIINNTVQILDDNLFLSSDYLGAIDHIKFDDGFRYYLLYVLTKNTMSLHHYTNSWLSDSFIIKFNDAIKSYEKLNKRLLSDWMKVECKCNLTGRNR